MNGVDVTDVTRNFTADDWDKLRAVGGHTYVYQRREYLSGSSRGRARDGRGTRGGRGGRGHQAGRNSDNASHAEERNVAAANVTDIVEYDASNSTLASHSSGTSSDRGGRTGGRFGPRRTDGLTTPTSASTMALGHLRNVSTIRSTTRYRSIHALDAVYSDPGAVARCELDSHADTCVAGPNFQLDEYTGEHCDVTPYSSDYQPLTNIPVVNASTAYTQKETGETIILRFNQILWYGNKLTMSLINPNQIRHAGIALSDDPTDKTRDFGINGVDFQIPFEMKGTTVFFETRVPTAWEYENCRIVELTVDTPWNPGEVNISNVHASNLTMEQLTYRNVCALERISRCEQQCDGKCQCGSDLSIYDSASLIRRMISSVQVTTANREHSMETTTVSFVGTKDRHSQVSAESVARKFRCGLETAQRTLKTTTQRGIRHAIHPLHRRYRVDHLNLHRRRLRDVFYMDTLFSKVKSISGFTCAQLITNGSFTRVYPMETKASVNIARALQEFVDDVGIPETLVCDFASEQTGKNTDVMKLIRHANIKLRTAEKGRGITQNHWAETEIREVKTKWKSRMRSAQVPARLWDYGLVYIAEIQSILARGSDRRPGIEKLTGETIDISEWLDFEFYDRIWYWDQKKMDMTDEQAKLGRWLGIAHRVGFCQDPIGHIASDPMRNTQPAPKLSLLVRHIHFLLIPIPDAVIEFKVQPL